MRGRVFVMRGGAGPDWTIRGLIVRLLGTAAGLLTASLIVPGIEVGDWQSLVAGAAVLAIVNIVVRPLAALVSCCLIILTLGLFMVVVNAAMLGLTAWVSDELGLNLEVDGVWSALGGAVVISIVATLVNALARPRPRRR